MRRESKSTTGSVVKDRRSQSRGSSFGGPMAAVTARRWAVFPLRRRHGTRRNSSESNRLNLNPSPPACQPWPRWWINTEQRRCQRDTTLEPDTNRGSDVFILPRWGQRLNSRNVQARPVELWLAFAVSSSERRKVAHSRDSQLACGILRCGRKTYRCSVNPMYIGDGERRVQACTKTAHSHRQSNSGCFCRAPSGTISTRWHSMCVCFGLRISECTRAEVVGRGLAQRHSASGARASCKQHRGRCENHRTRRKTMTMAREHVWKC